MDGSDSGGLNEGNFQENLVVIRRCETRFCCGAGCGCLDDIREDSSECSGEYTELSCYVEHKDQYWERKECCEGYEEDAKSICVVPDVNECLTTTHGCDQSCVNTVGSYKCECRSGYQLDTDGRTCKDVDECRADNGGCSHVCVNSVGSYSCACDNGYKLDSSDLHGCIDKDECSDGTHNCGHICNNVVGSFECSCRRGYLLAADKHTCDGKKISLHQV
ncbi:hypothetical protein NP493_656g01018 [Ridgeia piscesae]|uniref:EGF-like domain-containing protein n=1 Tax=Ridgeia piscesae TaxID=27915 RepID=A0AAD9KSK8_RIDPI|nr:hypothetical protein NP493_656g01018 [Ridgeia piscesae]